MRPQPGYQCRVACQHPRRLVREQDCARSAATGRGPNAAAVRTDGWRCQYCTISTNPWAREGDDELVEPRWAVHSHAKANAFKKKMTHNLMQHQRSKRRAATPAGLLSVDGWRPARSTPTGGIPIFPSRPNLFARTGADGGQPAARQSMADHGAGLEMAPAGCCVRCVQ